MLFLKDAKQVKLVILMFDIKFIMNYSIKIILKFKWHEKVYKYNTINKYPRERIINENAKLL